MAYESVLYEKDGEVASIILNRPEKLNAFDFPGQGGIYDDFYAALEEASDDDEVKVVIIKAAGRSFCAGHDLNTVGFVYGMGTGQPGEPRANQRIRLKVDRKWMEGHLKILLCPKITIAQVHGHCVGEGTVMMECCDFAIAAEDAQISHAEQRLGFSGSGINIVPLYFTVGLKRARDLLLTGRTITGKEAEEIGLVTKAIPADQLEEAVAQKAEALCLLPRDGIAIGKATTHLIYDRMGLTAGWGLGYYSHSFFTNVRFEPDEFNFFKSRRDQGTRTGFHLRDERYTELEP
jgi:enoyl-CoA hydratase